MEYDLEPETIYGTNDDCQVVMSERVQTLAGSIYQEFERMIAKYDEDVVKELMPLIVNVLETLDISCTENQEHEVELELLREDNEQLVTQYEREKQLRKCAEQKCLELEDTEDGEKKELESKVESLESILRMLELKSKNSSDHVSRLEDKENEMKKEYSKLHERYTELFKTHMDYMERTKILMGTDRLESLSTKQRCHLRCCMHFHNQITVQPSLNSSIGKSGIGNPVYNFNSMDSSLVGNLESPYDYNSGSIISNDNNSLGSSSSLQTEIQNVSKGTGGDIDNANVVTASNRKGMTDKSQLTDHINISDHSTATKGGWVDGLSDVSALSTPEVEEIENISGDPSFGGNIPETTQYYDNFREARRPNTLYQELSFQDSDALCEMDEGADITGMGKEVENLIMENNELLATKNALNVVKDDLIAQVDQLTSEQEILREEIQSVQTVKSKLQQRLKEMEEELKKIKEEAEKNSKSQKSDDEREDVPMAQRKRFTRVEMARVLMERNQYKERFMELQEAVRWTEMIRASRTDVPVDAKKNKSSVWKIFSNLFSSTEKPQRKPLPYVNVKYNAPTAHVSPALDTMRKKKLGDKHRGIDYLDCEIASEKVQQQRAKERREQYKQVRAHVKKNDGRLQAYGWSLPAKVPTNTTSNDQAQEDNQSTVATKKSQVPVPVPVYCRPLLEKEPGMKIWCAAGVNLTGGRTRDGGSIVGASVFYSNPEDKDDTDLKDPSKQSDIEKIEQELKDHEKDRKDNEDIERKLSSLVWICTSTHSTSKVTVIDANNPGDVLESFHVCNSHLLCVASVPGAKESDYVVDEEMNKLINNEKIIPAEQEKSKSPQSSPGYNKNDPSNDSNTGIGNITFVSCTTGSASLPSPTGSRRSLDSAHSEDLRPKRSTSLRSFDEKHVDKATEAHEVNQTTRRFIKDPTDQILDGVTAPATTNEVAYEEMEKMSSVLPTMWLGAQSGHIYVHSAVSQWKRCIHSLKLKDSVLNIDHIKGRVFAALADGTVAIFHRASGEIDDSSQSHSLKVCKFEIRTIFGSQIYRKALDGQWDLINYHLLDLGRPHHSIRCMSVVHNKVWCGYKNKIHIVNPKTMGVEKTFDAHPRKESQVRQMACVGDGVWVSIRLDSTLRLYHAHTYQHLQDVDIEPYVSKMLGSKQNKAITPGMSGRAPGGVVRVYADSRDKVSAASFIPYCSMAQAQLSFHGHRDAVKFFCSVPGIGGMSTATTQDIKDSEIKDKKEEPKCMLVISGGEGYVDFRIDLSSCATGDGDDEELEPLATNRESIDEDTTDNKPHLLSKGERSHLIVWQVTND
ncbi:C-Jun-amino-terminal kinase-interacting protein 4 [Nymphon striatum]|nr:C-Jun-amino-terminal kinase-interacting protein 4 [Nymphon striatum]